MRKNIVIFLIMFVVIPTFAQNNNQKQKETNARIILKQNQYIQVPANLSNKILSGKLIEKLSEKKALYENKKIQKKDYQSRVILYFEKYPTTSQVTQLENLGLNCFWELWTPPLENHPLGFVIADMPVDNFEKTLSLSFIKKMDTAEYVDYPHNNNGTQSIKAPAVWDMGYDGGGIKIGILDSGLDSYYKGTDLPSNYEAMDYSNYPNLDPNVENVVTGHGTHVVATALGRGVLSAGHSHPNNGEGAFKGSAPGASLTFLKIGDDQTGLASWDAEIAAMDAAVDIYNVDILSMSFGGWHVHHDGSSAMEQKADWVYENGIPFFISAGNYSDNSQHYSGTVSANGATDFIKAIVSNPSGANVVLEFNLVWFDGLGAHNDLTVEYYDEGFNRLYDVTINQNPSESLRGTESRYSHFNRYVISDATFYLKIINNSSSSQFFHLYCELGNSYLKFEQPDRFYTIGCPASADHVFTVGAYVSRKWWTDYSGESWSHNGDYFLNDIAPFSSCGPRVDGYMKPDIAAPGSAIISLRDADYYTTPNYYWIDNDGVSGGNANYYLMSGTSMACPMASGATALLLQKYPNLTPDEIYNAIKNNSNTDDLTSLPNNIWGYGRLDIYSAIMSFGSAPQAEADVDYLTFQTQSGNTVSSSFTLSNVGGGILSFDITVDDDFKRSISGDVNSNFIIKNKLGSGDKNSFRKKKFENEKDKNGIPKAILNKNIYENIFEPTGDDALIIDDGNDYPDSFLGWANGSNFNFLNQFDLDGFDFEMDALDFYIRTESASANRVYIAIYDEEFTTLAEGTIDYELSSDGKWFGAVIDTPLKFNDGETFNIAIETIDSGIDYPAGIDENASIPNKSFYFYGSAYHSLNNVAGFENGGFLIRAEGTVGESVSRVSVDPASGTIAEGNSENINVTFNAEGLSNGTYSGTLNIVTNGGNITIPIDFIVKVTEDESLPDDYVLYNNYPNPFSKGNNGNSATSIKYFIPKEGFVTLTIYNMLGEVVEKPVNGYQNSGLYEINFNASDLSSGVYYYRLEAGNFSAVKKMLLLK